MAIIGSDAWSLAASPDPAIDRLVADVWAVAMSTTFTDYRRTAPRWTGLLRRCLNELFDMYEAGQLRAGAAPATVWREIRDRVLLGDKGEVGVANASTSEALVDTHRRSRFCTPSILPELDLWPLPAVFETSLSDREIGAAPEGDGIFRDVETMLRDVHGARAAYPFLDGSTGAIRAIAEWICRWTPEPLVGVNRIAHKAVIHALEAHQVTWYYLDEPEWCSAFDAAGPIDPGALHLEDGTTHVWINSVTYEGAVADVGAVAAALGPNRPVLIVDEAWGAHLTFTRQLRQYRALECGADIVTTSVHKQGGGRQGTAVLLVSEDFVMRGEDLADRLQATVRSTVTTSPNLPLLATIQGATRTLADAGYAHVAESAQLADVLRQGLFVAEPLVSNHLFTMRGAVGLDPVKVVVHVEDCTGFDVAEALFERDIVVERDGFESLLFLVPFQVDCHDVAIACQAMWRIAADHTTGRWTPSHGPAKAPGSPFADTCRGPQHPVRGMEVEAIPVANSSNRTSADIVAAYPPGIPVIAPGDSISDTQVGYLVAVHNANGHVVSGAGCSDGQPGVYVIRET